MNEVAFIEVRAISDGADSDAARSFHDNMGEAMSNVAELMLAWAAVRRSSRSVGT